MIAQLNPSMNSCSRSLLRGLVALFSVALFGAAHAQGVYEWEAYGKRVDSAKSVQALGSDAFGDSVNLQDGALSFSVTDVDLPGNSSLPVRFTRTYTVVNSHQETPSHMLADWSVEVPRITGQFAPDWLTPAETTGLHPQKRCSNRWVPKVTDSPPGQAEAFPISSFWQGVQLQIPGVGGGELLVTKPFAGLAHPGASYKWTTDGQLHLSCDTTLTNPAKNGAPGGSGEGFVAITSDGTKYSFTHMAQRAGSPGLVAAIYSPTNPFSFTGTLTLPIRENSLYATRVEDRFGNWVKYTYTNNWNQAGKLTQIKANDGRQIDITYHPSTSRIHTVTASNNGAGLSRTWIYTYGQDGSQTQQPTLNRVTLPDTTSWQIQFANLSFAPIRYASAGEGAMRDCMTPATPIGFYDARPTGKVIHPSGASARFTLAMAEHGRTNVTLSCSNVTDVAGNMNGQNNNPVDDNNLFVGTSISWTLQEKVISGPSGTAANHSQTWGYRYVGSEPTFYLYTATTSAPLYPATTPSFPVCFGPRCYQPFCADSGCAGETQTIIARPDGNEEVYVFGNSWQYNEGKLLRVERRGPSTGQTLGPLLDSVANSYDLTRVDAHYPAIYGSSLRINVDGFDSQYHRPKIATVTARDGVNFNWTVDTCGLFPCMDVFARPKNVTLSSGLGFTKREAYEYFDLTSAWVLGQLLSTKVGGASGALTEIARAHYDSSQGQLQYLDLYGQRKQSLTYHPDGSVASVTDGKNQVTQLSNWNRGLPQTITYHDGSQETAVVNANGWIDSTTDAAQPPRTTGYLYDAVGRLRTITPPAPLAQTTISFGTVTGAFGLVSGHWRQSIVRGSYRQDTYLDALWRPVLAHEYQAGGTSRRVSVSGYDSMNRESFSAYPSSAATTIGQATKGVRRSFDGLGRLLSEATDNELGSQVSVTSIQYMPGFKKRITNPRNQSTTISFQAFAEPSEDAPTLIEAPESQTTQIQRDFYGKPERIWRTASVDGVQTTVNRFYAYDAQQRLCTRYEPETGVSVFNYDAADNIAWSAHGRNQVGDCNNSRAQVPRNEHITRNYDGRNRVLGINYPGATASSSFTYKPEGSLWTASRNNSTWTYGYNTLGLLETESLSFAGQTRVFTHGYDSLGNPSSISYPGGETINFAPNAFGQSTQIGVYANSIGYHANGALANATFGNGLSHTRTQNERLYPRVLKYEMAGQAQVSLQYTYDSNGNVERLDDLRPGGTDTQSFLYDGLDRLTSATASQSYGSASFTYDVFDNLRKHVLGNRDRRYQYADGSGRLTSLTDQNNSPIASYAYDARGNMSNDGPTTLSFDLADTVTRVNGPIGVEDYLYDAHGHRIQISASGQTRYPVYTKDGLLRAEYGTQTQTYYYLGSQLIARSGIAQRIDLIFSSGFEALLGSTAMSAIKSFLDKAAKSVVTTYYLSDHLGSNIATADQSGNISERTSYAPFGETWGETATRGPGYTGHFEDATGLTYMKARYYGGPVGRFMSPDPVGVDTSTGGNFNRYWYANNNPYKYVDPDGRLPVLLVPILITVAKEIGGEVFEHYTGVPASTKGLIKAGAKQVLKHSAKQATEAARKSGVPDSNFTTSVTEKYVRPRGAGPTADQKAAVQGKPCVDCGAVTERQVADHKVPLVVEHYTTGKIDVAKQSSIDAVQPHCPACSSIQGGQLGALSKKIIKENDL